MFVCIYIYIYTDTSIHTHTHTHTCVLTHTYICIHKYVCSQFNACTILEPLFRQYLVMQKQYATPSKMRFGWRIRGEQCRRPPHHTHWGCRRGARAGCTFTSHFEQPGLFNSFGGANKLGTYTNAMCTSVCTPLQRPHSYGQLSHVRSSQLRSASRVRRCSPPRVPRTLQQWPTLDPLSDDSAGRRADRAHINGACRGNGKPYDNGRFILSFCKSSRGSQTVQTAQIKFGYICQDHALLTYLPFQRLSAPKTSSKYVSASPPSSLQ